MELGTTCGGCGAHVAVEVPRWMLSAIEGAHTYSPPTPAHSFAPLDAVAARAAASGGWYTGPDDLAARAPAKHARRATFAPRIDWRETIVHGAIGTARTIKASPVSPVKAEKVAAGDGKLILRLLPPPPPSAAQIPGLVLTFFRALFAFMLLLDARFGLHQRAGVVLARFFEGVVEIEKEVGVMRNAGEALSIGWYVNYPYGEPVAPRLMDDPLTAGRPPSRASLVSQPPLQASRGTRPDCVYPFSLCKAGAGRKCRPCPAPDHRNHLHAATARNAATGARLRSSRDIVLPALPHRAHSRGV